MSDAKNVRSSPQSSPPNNSTGASAPKERKAKAGKSLATDRIQVPKQLAILRAYATASGPDGRVVTNNDVSPLVDMKPSTVAMANAFFTDTGLLIKSGNGFVPSADVIAFNRAYEWNPETAAQKLAPIFTRTWFFSALLPRLKFKNSLTEAEAIGLLADAAEAGVHHRPQLRIMLEFGAAVGLIQLEDGQVKYLKAEIPSEESDSILAPAPNLTASSASSTPAGDNSALAGALFPQNGAAGAVQFHFAVKVEMSELSGWQPDRIAAFFSGIAQVLAARGKTDEVPK
jgi:hypothetical protein